MIATDVDILRRARKRIENRRAWTKGQLARDAEGSPVDARSPAAVCFCAEGAIVAETNSLFSHAFNYLGAALGRKANGCVFTFNDSSSHPAVLRLFDRAIALAALAEVA